MYPALLLREINKILLEDLKVVAKLIEENKILKAN